MNARIYLGRLPYRATEKDVEKFLRGFGRIREVLLKDGYGFVEFDDPRDADDAVYELNGRDMMGERVSVELARGMPRGQDMWRDRDRGYYSSRGPPPRRRRGGGFGGGGGGGGGGRDKYGPPTRTDYRLIVENLSSRVSWQDLKDYMRQAGEVTYADAHRQVRNEGVIEFASYSGMKSAIEKLDDTEINGRRIRLIEDKPKRRRSRSRSHSRGRRSRSKSPRRRRSPSGSRSRSRSRSRGRKSRSRSMSGSRSRSRSRDRSPRQRSHSRSRSASPPRKKRGSDDSDAGSDKD